MGNDKGFRKMNELVEALGAAARGLGDGSLGHDALEQACDDARELYERLVVLRHKAREARQRQAPPPQQAMAPKPQAVQAPEEAKAPPPIRLDTRPDASVPRQTSLIEAIEATAEEPPPQPKPRSTSRNTARSGDAPPTLAEALGKAPISDLTRSIALSQKFWFVAELFNGDRILYDRSIDLINRMGRMDEAREYVEKEVLAKLPKPAGEEALSTFMDLVERRFL